MPAEDLIPIKKPTGLHRYVMRQTGWQINDVASIHQMEWSVIDFTTGSNGVERLEWRDVPLVEETDDKKVDRKIAEVRFLGADWGIKEAATEGITLSDLDARLAGGVASLAKQLQTSIERNAELNGLVHRYGRALEWIVNNPGAHPANMVSVAQEGLGRKP